MSPTDLNDPTPTPLSPSQQNLFVQIVGSVLFLSTRSRPDLSFSVNYLSLYMTKANQVHLDLAYKLLTYIWKTKDLNPQFQW
jgi:hypothetical protein